MVRVMGKKGAFEAGGGGGTQRHGWLSKYNEVIPCVYMYVPNPGSRDSLRGHSDGPESHDSIPKRKSNEITEIRP